MRKKRGYSRDIPLELVRDYRLFAIACEGSKTEPLYFNLFKYISRRIAVDVIEEVVSDDEMLTRLSNKSAPKWVLDRAVKYIEKEGLSDEDSLWFVIDVDNWKFDQLKEIADYCEQHPNWNIVLSNPCFEVWLYFHFQKEKPSQSKSCKELKTMVSTISEGNYLPYHFIPHLRNAIINAKLSDQNKKYFFPNNYETKVYKLGEAILKVVGTHFETFLDTKLQMFINERNEALGKK